MTERPAWMWFTTGFTNVVILFIGLITGIVAARLLGPEGRGELAVLLLWPSLFAALGLWSLPDAIVVKASSPTPPDQLAASSLVAALLLALLTVSAGLLVLPWILGDQYIHLLSVARPFLIAFVPLNYVGLVSLAVLQGQLQLTTYNVIRAAVPTVYLICLFPLWLAGLTSVESFACASIIGNLLPVIGAMFVLRHTFAHRTSLKEIKTLVRHGGRLHVWTVFALVSANAEKVLSAVLLHAAALGQFVVANTFAAVSANVVLQTMAVFVLPMVAREPDRQAQVRRIITYLHLAIICLFSISLALTVLCPFVIPLLFGDEFEQAVQVALLLLWAASFATLRHILGRALRALPVFWVASPAEGLFVVFLCLTCVLTPLGSSPTGLAFALLVGNALSLAFVLYLFARKCGVPLRQLSTVDSAAARRLWVHITALLRSRDK